MSNGHNAILPGLFMAGITAFLLGGLYVLAGNGPVLSGCVDQPQVPAACSIRGGCIGVAGRVVQDFISRDQSLARTD